jgi:hypothetical protein
MSFSFYGVGLADEVRAQIKAASASEVPKCLQEFLLIGINGLKDHYGPQVEVDVACRGHLCSDKSTYEGSGIDLHIRKKSFIAEIGDAVEKVEAKLDDSGAPDTDPINAETLAAAPGSQEPTIAETLQGAAAPVTLADVPHNDSAPTAEPKAE